MGVYECIVGCVAIISVAYVFGKVFDLFKNV